MMIKCNQINIDIDTGSTATTRKWQIKVTQYECGNLMAPENNCLQYHTATTGERLDEDVLKSYISPPGTIASFNWDTSSSSVSTTQYHLSSQYYDICIRRTRNYCSVCYSPQITTPTGSYGLSAGSIPGAQTNALGSLCTGVTTLNPAAGSMLGRGDYLDIVALQSPTAIGAGPGVIGTHRICGAFFSVAPTTAHSTACSWSIPFKVGVHFDADDAIAPATGAAAPDLDKVENGPTTTGYYGFYLAYWQNTC